MFALTVMEQINYLESNWFERNMFKATFLYVGKQQQDLLVECFVYHTKRDEPIGKITEYNGYVVVYVDELYFMRLGN